MATIAGKAPGPDDKVNSGQVDGMTNSKNAETLIERKRSIAGKDGHAEEHVVGDCNARPLDRAACRVLLAGGSFALGTQRRTYHRQ